MQTALINRISRNDQIEIDTMLCTYQGLPIDAYIILLQNAIKNITPYHYIYIGMIIGEVEATETALIEFHNQQNPLSKCRAN